MLSIRDIKIERALQIDLLRSADDLGEQKSIKERVDFLEEMMYDKSKQKQNKP